jgi:predicted dehydrogenase
MTWRWGIVGPGRIAHQFAEGMSLLDDGVITAIASRSQSRADEFGEKFGVAHRYAELNGLLEDPDVDVVYVATPHSQHAEVTLAALDAGKHVLCEKPMALSERQVRQMTERAESRGLFLMEAIWSRFLPSYVALRDILDTGKLGEPLVVESDFGFRAPVSRDHRLFNAALGGGALLDLGIYPVQLCSMVFGGPPDRITADGVVGETGVDEKIAAVMHYPSDGLGVVKAAIRVSLSCTGRISCTEGWIDLPAFMHCPHHLVVGSKDGLQRVECGYEGEGLRFQALEVHKCLERGLTESSIMPLDESRSIAATLDSIRSQVGVVYPGE